MPQKRVDPGQPGDRLTGAAPARSSSSSTPRLAAGGRDQLGGFLGGGDAAGRGQRLGDRRTIELHGCSLSDRLPGAQNQRARRLEPKCSFSATRASDGSWKVPVGFGPREEVDVDPADPPGAELDVAGAEPVVAVGLLAARGSPRSATRRTTRAAPSAKTPAFGTPDGRARRRPRRRSGSASAGSASSTGM